MGFFYKLFNQCAKPEGFLGKLMIGGMNKNAHVRLADWGMSHLTSISPEEIVEIGCGGGRNAGALLDKYPDAHAGFSGVKTKHHPSKPWILVLAKK